MRRSKAKSSQDREHKQKDGKPETKGNAMKHSVKDKKKKVHHVEANESEESNSDTDSDLGLISVSQKGKYSRGSVMPAVNGKKMEMELDTGAAVSLVPWEQYKRHLSKFPLQTTDIMLKTDWRASGTRVSH